MPILKASSQACQPDLPPKVEAHFRGLAEHFALCKLAPYSKRAVEEGWTTKPQTTPDEVVQWLRDGYGVGLRLGKPSGDLIAIDIDGTSGINWLWQPGRGHPTDKRRPDGVDFDVPTIRSTRGNKYLVRLPEGMSLSKIDPPDADVELLGDGHQIALPSPFAPDEREWVKIWSNVFAPELCYMPEWGSRHPGASLSYTTNVIPEAAKWLKRYIKGHQARPRKTKTKKRPTQRQPSARYGERACKGDVFGCPAIRWIRERKIAIGSRNNATTAQAIMATHGKSGHEAEARILEWFNNGGTEAGPGADGEPFTAKDVSSTVRSTYKHHSAQDTRLGLAPNILTAITDVDGNRMPMHVAKTVFQYLPKAPDYQPQPLDNLERKPILYTFTKVLEAWFDQARRKGTPVITTTAKATAQAAEVPQATVANRLWPALRQQGIAWTTKTAYGTATTLDLTKIKGTARGQHLIALLRGVVDEKHSRNLWRYFARRFRRLVHRLFFLIERLLAWIWSLASLVDVAAVACVSAASLPLGCGGRDPPGAGVGAGENGSEPARVRGGMLRLERFLNGIRDELVAKGWTGCALEQELERHRQNLMKTFDMSMFP